MSSPQKKRKGSEVRTWEEELKRAFGGKLEGRVVIEVAGTNPEPSKNLGCKANQITLRSSLQANKGDTIELQQFDPCFMSSEVTCRSPGCNKKKEREVEVCGKIKKQDLYLCPRHGSLVESYVAKICAENEVSVGKHSPEDFKGYTTFIGMLEEAFFFSVKSPPGSATRHPILQEMLLNLRNFLMITNALLNPNVANLNMVLPAVMAMFREAVKLTREDRENIREELENLVDLVRRVVEHILFAFGVVYSWVYLALVGNAGAQLGAGIGGLIGVAGVFIVGPVPGLVAMAGGALFGGWTGSGLSNLFMDRGGQQTRYGSFERYQEFMRLHRFEEDQNQQQMLHHEQPNDEVIYEVTGSPMGDLLLAAIMCFGPMGFI